MKKTILIGTSILLNISFILLFVFLQIDDSNDKKEKSETILEMIDKLSEKNDMSSTRIEQDHSKTEFYDNNEIKYKKLVFPDGKVVESFFFENGTLDKEKTYLNSKPSLDVSYHRDGSRKSLLVYEKDNLVSIITNYPNGQIESEGKKLRFSGKNDMYHGRWIWYNQDGTVRDERNFN